MIGGIIDGMNERFERVFEKITGRHNASETILHPQTRAMIRIGYESSYDGTTVYASLGEKALGRWITVTETELSMVDSRYLHFILDSSVREKALRQGKAAEVAAENARLAQRFIRERPDLLPPDFKHNLKEVYLYVERPQNPQDF